MRHVDHSVNGLKRPSICKELLISYVVARGNTGRRYTVHLFVNISLKPQYS